MDTWINFYQLRLSNPLIIFCCFSLSIKCHMLNITVYHSPMLHDIICIKLNLLKRIETDKSLWITHAMPVIVLLDLASWLVVTHMFTVLILYYALFITLHSMMCSQQEQCSILLL